MASGPSASSAIAGWTDDEIMRHLSRDSPDVWNSMLEEAGVLNGSTLNRNAPSSIGDLDRLSSETLCLILQHLDLQSLCRFMAASFRGKELVESMLIYRNLIKHASSVLIVIGKTNLASQHTVLDLYSALLSVDCVSCHRFGAFLFLPTYERACLNCLHRNMRFWVLPVPEAQYMYGIQQKEVHWLPTMLSNQVTGKKRGRRRKFASVRLALELGLAIHGSRQAMTSWVMQSGKLGNKLDQYSWWAEVGAKLVDWNTEDPLLPPVSSYWGSASIRFPNLRRNQVLDPGYWCEGCRFKRKQISEVSTYSHGMDYIGRTPEDEAELVIRHREELREWSRTTLKEHVLTCVGARELASRIDKK